MSSESITLACRLAAISDGLSSAWRTVTFV